MRHPLPYAYAKTHTVLLEDDGARMVLWAPETVELPALSEVLRMYDVDAFEREAATTLTSRIAAAYAGGESSAAVVIGEVESAVDLSRMMQELPAIEDLLEASNDAPIIRMLNALLTQAAKDGASDIHIEPYERSSSVRFRVAGTPPAGAPPHPARAGRRSSSQREWSISRSSGYSSGSVSSRRAASSARVESR